jgi:hypothetical protein
VMETDELYNQRLKRGGRGNNRELLKQNFWCGFSVLVDFWCVIAVDRRLREEEKNYCGLSVSFIYNRVSPVAPPMGICHGVLCLASSFSSPGSVENL